LFKGTGKVSRGQTLGEDNPATTDVVPRTIEGHSVSTKGNNRKKWDTAGGGY